MFEMVGDQDQLVLDRLYADYEADVVAQFAPAEWVVDPRDLDPGSDPELAADAVLARAAETQRMLNLTGAEQLVLACRWADLNRDLAFPVVPGKGREKLIYPGGEGTPGFAEFCLAEFGAVMAMTGHQAGALITDALDLRHRFPTLWERVQTGLVQPWIARKVADKSRTLSLEAAGRVDRRIARHVGPVSYSRLMKIVAAEILHADREQATTDTANAAAQQGVWVSRDDDHGYATLVGKAPAPDLQAVDLSLDELARAMSVLGDTDSHDLRRAKALALLANPSGALDLISQANELLAATADHTTLTGPHDGVTPRRRCDLGRAILYVHVTDQSLHAGDGVARVEGVGPALMGQIRDWLGHRQVTVKQVIDIPGIRPVDCYEVPDRMAEAVTLINPATCFPYGVNTGRGGDTDHNEKYIPIDEGGPPGQTRMDNLGRLIRFEHRIKTHGGWEVWQPRTGCWLWRSPRGYHYLVDEHGTTALGKL